MSKTQALPSRFEAARHAAVQLLKPNVVHVVLPKRTLNDEAELEAWLRGLRGQAPESSAGQKAHAEGQCLQRALSATATAKEQPALSPRELDALLHAEARRAGCEVFAPARIAALDPPAGRLDLALSDCIAFEIFWC